MDLRSLFFDLFSVLVSRDIVVKQFVLIFDKLSGLDAIGVFEPSVWI